MQFDIMATVAIYVEVGNIINLPGLLFLEKRLSCQTRYSVFIQNAAHESCEKQETLEKSLSI